MVWDFTHVAKQVREEYNQSKCEHVDFSLKLKKKILFSFT